MSGIRVVSVRRESPVEWRERPGHLYVGRALLLRSGPHAHQKWPNSALRNPFKGPGAVEKFREYLLSDKSEAAWHARQNVIEFRQRWKSGTPLTLGCWCGAWQPGEKPIDCHAVVIVEAILKQGVFS